jgi:hypothetical protein
MPDPCDLSPTSKFRTRGANTRVCRVETLDAFSLSPHCQQIAGIAHWPSGIRRSGAQPAVLFDRSRFIAIPRDVRMRSPSLSRHRLPGLLECRGETRLTDGPKTETSVSRMSLPGTRSVTLPSMDSSGGNLEIRSRIAQTWNKSRQLRRELLQLARALTTGPPAPTRHP